MPAPRIRRQGVGEVLAGRVEQRAVKPGESATLLPMHPSSYPCTGKGVTVEMHHVRADVANPGGHAGADIKGLDKNNTGQ